MDPFQGRPQGLIVVLVVSSQVRWPKSALSWTRVGQLKSDKPAPRGTRASCRAPRLGPTVDRRPSRAQCFLRLLTSLMVSAWLSFAGAASGRLMLTVSTPLSLCFFFSVAPAALLSFRTMLLLLLPATEKATLLYTGGAFAFALAAEVCPVPVPVSVALPLQPAGFLQRAMNTNWPQLTVCPEPGSIPKSPAATSPQPSSGGM